VPPLIYRPCSVWPLSNLWKCFTDLETRVFQAADSEDLVVLACTVFDWSTRVTDEQTDGQNCDGWDMLQQYLLSRVKILNHLNFYSWSCLTHSWHSLPISHTVTITSSYVDLYDLYFHTVHMPITHPPASRRLGRAGHSWLRTVETDMCPLNLGLATAQRRAQDRAAWRLHVATSKIICVNLSFFSMNKNAYISMTSS